MEWLTDAGDRKGSDLAAFRVGNFIALVICAAVVAAPVTWFLLQVLR
jgi:hypothetical protein